MDDRYLFKAKRIDNGEWVQGYFVKKHGTPFIYETRECPQNNYEVDESTLCQCTGGKDRNGVLIYQRDIIQTYIDDKFDGMVIDRDCEVIGNVFDNPELIEVGK